MNGFFKLYLDSYRGISRPAWILTLIMLINRSGAMVVPFLGVYMSEALHFDLKETGAVLSCFGLGAVSGSLLGGLLTDRAGHFKVQLLSLILSVPVFCTLPYLLTPLTLAIGVFSLSLITETFRPANSVSIASYARPENVTKAFSLNRMAMNLGFSIGPALGGLLAAISYHWLFYGNAASVSMAALVFFLYFRNRKGHRSDHKKAMHPDDPTSKFGTSPWKDKIFIAFSVLCSLYGICFFQLLNTLPLFYKKVHLLNEASIGLLLAFSGMVVFLLEMLLVHIAERRLTAGQTIILGTLFCGISFIMLNLSTSIWMLYAGIFVLCLSEILAMPFMATVTMQRAPTERQGAYMGLNALAFSIAHILSPFLGTRVADHFGFPMLWWSTGLLCAITALGFWGVMKRI